MTTKTDKARKAELKSEIIRREAALEAHDKRDAFRATHKKTLEKELTKLVKELGKLEGTVSDKGAKSKSGKKSNTKKKSNKTKPATKATPIKAGFFSKTFGWLNHPLTYTLIPILGLLYAFFTVTIVNNLSGLWIWTPVIIPCLILIGAAIGAVFWNWLTRGRVEKE